MMTTTKKDLVDRIAATTGMKRVMVKRVVQQFLDEVVAELAAGNRLEFRDFGVFERKVRAARTAQNPKTLDPVIVPERAAVKFKPGRKMREFVEQGPAATPGPAAPDRPAPDAQSPKAGSGAPERPKTAKPDVTVRPDAMPGRNHSNHRADAPEDGVGGRAVPDQPVHVERL